MEYTVAFEGRNEWFAGGWIENHYRDAVDHVVTGPQSGWVDAEGHLVGSEGSYPSP